MKMYQSIWAVGLTLAMIAGSCNRNLTGQQPEKVSNRVLLDWNVAAYEAMGGKSYQHSLMASRVNAMVHIAMHDAINAIQPKYDQYAYRETVRTANIETAAAYAAHTVLASSFPEKRSMLDSMLSVSIQHVPINESKTEGMQVGMEAGNAILANRADDGAGTNPIMKIEPSSVSGVYNVVPPFDFVFAPHWKSMKLFGLKTHDQFRPLPPPALNSMEYKAGFDEVKELGKMNSVSRTADQTFYAKFWYEFSEIGWNRVARVVATDKKLDLVESARLFALLNMAMADAYTAGWDAKFHYNFWRPFTAIRGAAKDPNEHTTGDNSWEPAEPTPPVQDYPSTHSALGNAAAEVLIAVFGDNTPFTFTSFTSSPAGATRSFRSFSQAADENADSRVMAGIHFRFSCEAGQTLGSKIGSYIVQNHLKAR